MMLLSKMRFQISTNVPEEELKKDGIKGGIDHFNAVLNSVIELMPSDWDVDVDKDRPHCRKRIVKLGGKDLKMAHIIWEGTGREEDVRKWVELWNEVEGLRAPCYFIKLNTDPFLPMLHDYASQDSQIVRTKKRARKPKE